MVVMGRLDICGSLGEELYVLLPGSPWCSVPQAAPRGVAGRHRRVVRRRRVRLARRFHVATIKRFFVR